MKKAIGFSLLALTLVPRMAFAVCAPVPSAAEGDGAYELTASLVRGLEHIKYAATDVRKAQPKSPKEMEAQSVALISAYKRAVANLECVQGVFDPYVASTDPDVKLAAGTVAAAFMSLSLMFRANLEDAVATLNGDYVGEKPGDKAIRLADQEINTTEAWKGLAEAIRTTKDALVESANDERTGGRLKISELQRKSLKKDLVTIFGKEIEKGAKAGQLLETSAADLHKFLSDKGWKSFDQ